MFLRQRVKSQWREYLTWGVREELGLLEADETMLTLGFMLRSLSSWYMRSRSTSGRLRKFCMALRFTKRDWDAVRGSSSFRRISDNNPWLKGKKKKSRPRYICRYVVRLLSGAPHPCTLPLCLGPAGCDVKNLGLIPDSSQARRFGGIVLGSWGLCVILDHSILTLYHHCNNQQCTEMPASKVGAWEELWNCNYHQVPPTSISGTVRTLSAWNWEHLAVLLSFTNLPSLVNLVPTFKQHGRFTST